MLFSRSWIGEYVEAPPTDELAAGLSAVGLNVETIDERGGDAILDLEITPNRTDCMNHLGVAREVAVKFERELRRPEVPAAGEGEVGVPIEIDDLEDCPRYVGVVIDGVTVGPSPAWLVDRLESIGVRSINNVVDATNFVLWEWGQPLHAFDLDTLTGGRIVVRRARSGERLTTLDDVERELDSDVLVIADAERAVALAGIMGGAETEVGAGSGTVLLESAHFNPQLVRNGASRLGMHTDASHRFERGTDPEACVDAALRAAHLIAELTGGSVRPGVADVRDRDRGWRPVGHLDHDRLQRFGGVEVTPAEVERILTGLGYELEAREGSWQVTLPSWRYYDQEAFRAEGPPPEVWPADLYEEVLRVVGLEAIPATLPRVSEPDAGSWTEFTFTRRMRQRLAGMGLLETISYSFESESANRSFDSILIDPAAVEVKNPVSESFQWMRRSLLPGLTEAARFNQNRGADSVELFELGRVFAGDGREVDCLGVAVGGGAANEWDRRQNWDFFDLKGLVERLLKPGVAFEPAALTGLVEGSAARLLDAEGWVVGQIGEVADPDLRYPLFAAEIALDAVARPEARDVVAPSQHPSVTADITITHAEDLPWAKLAAAIDGERAAELSEFGLKDRYTGEGVPEGAVNTTIWFRYNAADRSLTQEEVNQYQEGIRQRLEEEFGWPQAKTTQAKTSN